MRGRAWAMVACLALLCCGRSAPLEPAMPAAATLEVAIYQARDPRLGEPMAVPGQRSVPGGEAAAPVGLERGAVVVERRLVDLRPGRQQVVLGELASGLETGSLMVRTFGEVHLLDRRLEGPASPAELIAGARGQRVRLDTIDGPVVGVLILAGRLSWIVRRGEVDVRVPRDRVRSVAVTAPVAAAPRVIVRLEAARAGRFVIELAYRVPEVSWQVDHHIVLERRAGQGRVATARLTVRATIGRFRPAGRAHVTLLAGGLGGAERAHALWSGPLDLGRPTAVELARDVAIGARIEHRYHGAIGDPATADTEPLFGTQSRAEVEEVLVFENRGTGTLPAGLVVVTESIDGARVERRGELATRVAAGERAHIRIGIAPGMRGERRQLAVERSADGLRVVESYEVVVKNVEDEPATVHVIEPLARSGEVEIKAAAPTPVRRERELDFSLTVPARGSARATYQAVYRWQKP